jgi:hypothetical protein
MRFTTIFFLLTISISVTGQQTPNFEQLAFDYYRNTILTENPHKKKRVTFWTEIEKKEYLFWYPRCIDNFDDEKWKDFISNPSQTTTIDTKGDKRFKIKKLGTGGYPRVFSTASFSNKDNQHIVTIVEINKWDGITYHIEMDDLGQIKKWCRGGWIE